MAKVMTVQSSRNPPPRGPAITTIHQFVRFLTIGSIVTVVHFGILVALVSSIEVSPTLASTAGFVVSATMNYLLNYTYTFRSTARHSAAILKFVLVALIGLSLNAALMKIGTDGLGSNYLFVQAVAIACVVVWNFLANKHWTFGPARKAEDVV